MSGIQKVENIMVIAMLVVTAIIFIGGVASFFVEREITKVYCHKHFKAHSEEYNMCLWSKHYMRIQGEQHE